MGRRVRVHQGPVEPVGDVGSPSRQEPWILSVCHATCAQCARRSSFAAPSRIPRGTCGSGLWSPPTSRCETYSTPAAQRRSKSILRSSCVLRSYRFLHLHSENLIFQMRPGWREGSHARRQPNMPAQRPDLHHQLVTFFEEPYLSLGREREFQSDRIIAVHLFER